MAELPGASLAVITENLQGEHCVVAIQRDNKPIAYRGWWELPGGTLEEGEDPKSGSIRECYEEVNVIVDPEEVHGNDEHLIEGSSNIVLVVAFVSFKKVLAMRLGDEGQACGLFELNEFFRNKNVIPEHRMRLQRYLQHMGSTALADCLAGLRSSAHDQIKVS